MQIQLITGDTGNKLDNSPISVCGSQRRGQKTVLDVPSHLEILLRTAGATETEPHLLERSTSIAAGGHVTAGVWLSLRN